jgi:hypothetical protein
MIRWMVGLAGLPIAGYGAWLAFSRQDFDQLLNAGIWLAGGVVVHDGAIAGAALLGALVVALLPSATRAPAAVALVVVGSLTLVALPALGGFGEQPDNPTHLDRPYLAAWLVVVVVAVLGVVVAGIVRSRRAEV